MALLVRTWNLFHGNTVPTGRRDRLEEMVRLAAADRPDVVCLQEVPLWAVGHLRDWSGMAVFADVAQPAQLGPLPSTAAIGRAITDLHHGLFRSAFTGQANAILAGSGLQAVDRRRLVLNPRPFRRRQARAFGLPLLARLVWAKERRVCQAVRFRLADDRTLLVTNFHATSYPRDPRLSEAEVLRAACFADALAEPSDVCILAGDFNSLGRSPVLAELTRPEWGFAVAGVGPGVDHILVRGAAALPVERWPDVRRRHNGRLLSDHAPLELRVE